MANLFWYAWWITIGASYILIAQALGWAGDYLWGCILSGVVGGGRKWIIFACGAYLVYLGVAFIFSSL